MHTYIAEQNLASDSKGPPIDHLSIANYFEHFGEDSYVLLRKAN